jgi:hypothetical protein
MISNREIAHCKKADCFITPRAIAPGFITQSAFLPHSRERNSYLITYLAFPANCWIIGGQAAANGSLHHALSRYIHSPSASLPLAGVKLVPRNTPAFGVIKLQS